MRGAVDFKTPLGRCLVRESLCYKKTDFPASLQAPLSYEIIIRSEIAKTRADAENLGTTPCTS